MGRFRVNYGNNSQSNQRNLYGRFIRLDALRTLDNGIKCNIEAQRSDNDNNLKSTRFNAVSIFANNSSSKVMEFIPNWSWC